MVDIYISSMVSGEVHPALVTYARELVSTSGNCHRGCEQRSAQLDTLKEKQSLLHVVADAFVKEPDAPTLQALRLLVWFVVCLFISLLRAIPASVCAREDEHPGT